MLISFCCLSKLYLPFYIYFVSIPPSLLICYLYSVLFVSVALNIFSDLYHIYLVLCVSVPFSFTFTVVPTRSDSDVILCLQLLSNTLTCTLHLS